MVFVVLLDALALFGEGGEEVQRRAAAVTARGRAGGAGAASRRSSGDPVAMVSERMAPAWTGVSLPLPAAAGSASAPKPAGLPSEEQGASE